MKEKLAAFGMKCDFHIIGNVSEEVKRSRVTDPVMLKSQSITRQNAIRKCMTTFASTAASMTSTLKVIYSNMQPQSISKEFRKSVPEAFKQTKNHFWK